MSFQNLQTNEVYRLKPNEPVILGRGKYGLNDPYTSREHVKITFLENGKCFVEKLSRNMAKLNSGHLPENKEIEAYDQDILEIPVNNLFRLTLPKSSKGVYRPTSVVTTTTTESDNTDDELEPLSFVEQTDTQFIVAPTLEQAINGSDSEDEPMTSSPRQSVSNHDSSDDNEKEEEEDQDDDNSHLLLDDDESISTESDLLGEYE